MNNTKTTKRALLSSVMAIVLCLAMLIGTTFAWFTDTASTAVNKIQAGTLDVQLLDENGNSLEGRTLAWQKAAGHENDEVLWEPGCTYQLQPIVIKNNGNLALKYKIVISGIKGSAKLNEAIEWTMTNGGTPVSINDGTEVSLAPNATSGNIIIKGQMKKNADNEYQGLSIDGIAITVYATQKDTEFDSFNNSYDAGATYPVEIIPAVNATMAAAAPNEDGKIESYSFANSDNTLTAIYKPNTAADSAAAAPKIVVKPTSKDAGNVTIDTATQEAIAYEISLQNAEGAALSNSGLTTLTIKVGTGLTGVVLYHNDTPMTAVNNVSAVDADGKFYYDGTTGTVTFATSSFSPFTIVFDSPVAVAGGVSYYDLQSALNAGGKVILLKDVDVADTLIVKKTVTLDMNGKKLYNSSNIWTDTDTVDKWSLISVRNSGNLTVTGDGIFEAKENDCYAIDLMDGAKCTIENGTFIGNLASAYVYEGDLTIKGGSFTIQQLNETNPYAYILNCYDANYHNETAKITVTGGKFFNYDPSNAPCENPKANFCSAGKDALKNGDWYEVVDGAVVSTEAELTTALTGSDSTIYLANDINLSEALEIKSTMTINGNNHKLTIPNSDGARVININDNTNPITLTLKDLDVVGPTSGTYTRGISAFKNNGDLKLILDNCSASANYYALNIAKENSNVEVIVKNGTYAAGWCAFQTWSAGTKATFENCTLIGNNDKTYNADGWNNFATVVINENTTNVELTFKNCRIEANQTTGNKQYLMSVRASGAKVTVDGCTFFANGTEIADKDLGNYLNIYSAARDLVLTIDGTVIPIG